MHDGSPGSAQTAQNQLNEKAEAASTANRAAGAAWDKVDNIRRQAQQLMETWHQNGAACAEQLNRAAELAPDKGFFESIGDALIGAGDWVMDHLEQIGDVAGMISAVAGALAFIPVLTPVMAPIAIVSGGAALAAHAGDIVANGKAGSLNAWISVGGDALGLIPGVGAISRGVDAATTSLRTVDGLMPAAASGFSDFAAEAARTGGDAASAFKWLGQNAADTFGGSADVLAKSMQGGVNVALQGPTAADWVVGNGTTGDVKNAAGAASAGLNSVQGVGSYGEAVHGGFDIGRSLRGFAAAVG
ncbi:hypothetical protein FHS23_002938 [Prauserella isguenensis]|uniref:WXG100 family type VII secretion target n=1 Tax=Prauserella isguenensis TaxID=1470180 RepID=A0A839S5B2_9PSEU|nr:hypothetical protein [Prauserella isguenensis]MBB3051909.1 hypothetical protein [Prauserella isguenensis]